MQSALLARYAGQGSARLLPVTRSTNWDEAGTTWERLVLPARIAGGEISLVRVREATSNPTALRALVERLRAEAPRQVDLMCEETTRPQAVRLVHLLVLTQGLVGRAVAG